ncbi:MAG: nickel insertion protein [Chthoniobacteraceae bacterium]
MKALYLDCISGISGDMMVGALIDLGVKPSALEWELSKLHIGDFHMHYDRAKRKDIEGVKFDIHGGATHVEHGEHGHDCGHEHGHEHSHEHSHEHDHTHGPECGHEHGEEGHVHHHHEHDHDPEHLHAHEHTEEHATLKHTHEHSHGEQTHSHEHEHGDDCCGHGHSHEHGHEQDHEHVHGRTHREIRALIEVSDLSPFVKKHSLGIFQRIAEAEGKIHGVSVEDVHFHEVGALDSIADIVLSCTGIEALGVEKVFVSNLHDGHGTVKCAHGIFPVPAPATMEILKGIPLGQIDVPHELITPTGAGIAAEFSAGFGLMPAMKVERIGYGLGTRELADRPNVLRAVLGELA